VKPASECSDEDYLNFYRYLYPGERDPLFWIHLNVDYPFHLQGILYFPHMKRQTEMDKHMIHLYCNRVFVSENCKEVIPEFLMGLRGIIDSPDIPLNVSRSYLQMDRTVRQLSSHIAKKVADRLTTLERTNREKFIASWTDIEVIVKLGAIQDEKFYDRVSKIIIWKNSDGEWTTVADYLERNREKTDGKIFYATGDDSQSSFIDLYKQQGIEVLHSNSLIDTYLINFLETKLENARFQRIDGAIDDAIIDSSREKTVLNADGQSQQTAIASAIKSHLSDENVEVEAKSLASDALPAFIMIDENSRRMRDYMSAADPENGKSMFAMMGKKTFVVNTNNTLVNAVETVTEKNPEVAKELVEHMYDLALLSQRELDPGKLNDFIARSNQVLEHLAGKIVES
jgi:molecular chaperone HtpG